MSLLIFCKEWRDQISSTCVLHMAILAIVQYTVKTLDYLNQIKAPWVVWASWLMSSLGIFMALKVTATFWHVFFLPQNRHELGRYPAKDYATYWECEEYTKAWGHGSKENPLPLNSVPREKGPMRDRIWFREPTTIPRLPKSLEPVPNK